MKTKSFVVHVETYYHDIIFSFGETDKDLAKKLKKLLGYTPDPDSYELGSRKGKSVMWGSGQTLVRLPKLPVTPFEYAVLQHEIFHSIEFISDRIGLKLSGDSAESFAYLTQYITHKVYENL